MSRPKGAKELWMEQELQKPENWVTRTCVYCSDKFHVNLKFLNFHEQEHEASYCSECQEKIIWSGRLNSY